MTTNETALREAWNSLAKIDAIVKRGPGEGVLQTIAEIALAASEGLSALQSPSQPVVPDGVWSRPWYKAADEAYQKAMIEDCNDRMSALAAAVDAALAAHPQASPPPVQGEVTQVLADLTRPIISIEKRTAQEAFDIMADRIRHKFASLSQPSPASSTAGEVREAVAIRIGAALPQFVAGLERSEWLVLADAALSALSPSSGEPASVAVEADGKWPATCDGIEQDAFEEWAKAQGMDMQTHPLHWLFLNEKTDAARQGWKAGLVHASERAAALSKPTPVEAGLRLDRDVIAYSIIEGSGGIRAAEHAKDFKTANWTDALRSADAVIVALAALSETQPPRETSTDTKESGE